MWKIAKFEPQSIADLGILARYVLIDGVAYSAPPTDQGEHALLVILERLASVEGQS